MGEAGLRKTLGMFGEIKSIEVEAADDGLSCSGKVQPYYTILILPPHYDSTTLTYYCTAILCFTTIL